jgi:hypothetical protein
MKYNDIQDALATLARLSELLEDQYVENEGEVTEETEALEERKAAIQDLLQNDGIDALGRWLKVKEDEVKMWKAEKAAADRKVKSAQNTVDFVKSKIAEVMDAVGMEKAKGSYYSFSKYVSEKSAVNQEELERIWLDIASSAAHAAGLPAYVDVVLKTTTTALKDAEATEFIQTSTADAVRFTKPRGTKE